MDRIRQDLHFVIQGGFDHPSFYAREPCQKLLHGGPIAEILKVGGDGHARAAKDPGPANFAGCLSTALHEFQSFMSSSLLRGVRGDGAGQTADCQDGRKGGGARILHLLTRLLVRRAAGRAVHSIA